MDAIKLKAWDKKKNRWLTSSEISEYVFPNAIVFPEGTGEFLVDHNMKREINLIRYSGLRDKNGKEIWEGDIVKFDSEGVKWEAAGITGEVVFERGAFRVGCYEGYKTVLDTGDCCEVIGNIYETPSLSTTCPEGNEDEKDNVKSGS